MINQKFMMNYILAMHPGQPIDGEVLNFLQTGFKDYLYQRKSLDEAFCFKQSRIRADHLKRERDLHLRAAALYYIEHESPSDLCRKLEKEIHRFETTNWLKWKNLNVPPDDIPCLHFHLFYAKKTGLKMPQFKQIMRDII